MIKRSFVFLVFLPFSVFGANQLSNSNYLKVLDNKSTVFSLIPSYSSETFNATGSISGRKRIEETSYQDNILRLQKGFGTSSTFEVETVFGHKTLRREINRSLSKFSSSGNGDFKFTLKSLEENGSSNLIWGGDLNISPTNQEMASTTREGNYTSGGHSIRPFLGYEIKNDNFVAGGLVSYQVFGERKEVFIGDSSQFENTNGGNVIEASGFAEIKNENKAYGLLAGVEWEDAKSVSTDEDSFKLDSESHLKAKLYANLNINENFSLFPSLKYKTLIGNSKINRWDVNVDESYEIYLGLGFSN